MENYATLRKSGAITIDPSTTHSKLVILVKQYDPNTGTVLDPSTFQVDLYEVNRQINILQPRLTNWQAMLSDFPK